MNQNKVELDTEALVEFKHRFAGFSDKNEEYVQKNFGVLYGLLKELTAEKDAHAYLIERSNLEFARYAEDIKRMADEIEELKKDRDAVREEHGLLERTVQFMEQSYLEEHGHWGSCTNLERAETAESQLSALQEVAKEMSEALREANETACSDTCDGEQNVHTKECKLACKALAAYNAFTTKPPA